MKKFSKSWKSSKDPRKQRRYTRNAPLHIKRSMLVSRFSKELTKKYGKRNIGIRKGDKVKIVRGNFKAHAGKVEKILTKRLRVCIENIQVSKKDGKKAYYPIHPSNLIITELDLGDKKRTKILERKTEKQNG